MANISTINNQNFFIVKLESNYSLRARVLRLFYFNYKEIIILIFFSKQKQNKTPRTTSPFTFIILHFKFYI